MPFSDYLDQKILEKAFLGQDFQVTEHWCSLHTADPGKTGQGEASGAPYTRKTVSPFTSVDNDGNAKRVRNVALLLIQVPAGTYTDAGLDATTDPATVACTVNPDTARVFLVGDFIVFNDESADPNNPGRRSYECAQIIGPGHTGDVVSTGDFVFQRAYPGVPEGQATFGTMRCAHLAGMRFYKLDQKTFTFSVRKGFFRTPGLPARIEAKLPSACLVAALAPDTGSDLSVVIQT